MAYLFQRNEYHWMSHCRQNHDYRSLSSRPHNSWLDPEAQWKNCQTYIIRSSANYREAAHTPAGNRAAEGPDALSSPG